MVEERSYWLGKADCAYCRVDIRSLGEGAIMYDAVTDTGPWAVMCDPCYEKHGVGLGTGRGQKYELQKVDDVLMFVKIEG